MNRTKLRFHDYTIGIDVASENSSDYSFLTIVCGNCNTLVYAESFIGEEPVMNLPAYCPTCGIEFKQGYVVT